MHVFLVSSGHVAVVRAVYHYQAQHVSTRGGGGEGRGKGRGGEGEGEGRELDWHD